MARRQAAATSWARMWCAELSKNHRAPGGTRTLVAALRVRCPRRWTTSALISVGPEGLEPSPGGLRVRCAAASTLIPFSASLRTQNRRGGNRTLDLTLIRGLLSPLSYAPSVGPKGLEPLPAGLKVRCAAVTPRPQMQVGRMRFHRVCFMVMLLVFSGSPESRTQRYPVISRFGQPALDYHLPTSLSDQVGMAGLEPASPCSQSTWVRRYPTSRCHFQSERADLNRRSPGPRPGAIPRLRYVLLSVSSYGSRTRLAALKGRCPRTDRRTSHRRRIFSTQLTHGVARTFHAVGRAVLESASPGFQARCYTISATDPTTTKKPDVVMTPGFRYSSGIGTA